MGCDRAMLAPVVGAVVDRKPMSSANIFRDESESISSRLSGRKCSTPQTPAASGASPHHTSSVHSSGLMKKTSAPKDMALPDNANPREANANPRSHDDLPHRWRRLRPGSRTDAPDSPNNDSNSGGPGGSGGVFERGVLPVKRRGVEEGHRVRL